MSATYVRTNGIIKIKISSGEKTLLNGRVKDFSEFQQIIKELLELGW